MGRSRVPAGTDRDAKRAGMDVAPVDPRAEASAPAMADGGVALRLTGLRKEYPGVVALGWAPDDFLDIRRGEIHGFVGENGAGKSTLLSLVAGLQSPSAGFIELAGERLPHLNVSQARTAGIDIITQEPGLVGALTVKENFFLGRDGTGTKLGVVVNPHRATVVVREALKAVGLDTSPQATVLSLPLGEQKLVELARAIHFKPSVLLVDEMSACLDQSSRRLLFNIVRAQRDAGVTVLYVSHHLEEVSRLCDRISVLRDGAIVATLPAVDADDDRLTTLMVGRTMAHGLYPERVSSDRDGDVVFRATELGLRGRFANVSFDARRGEILGVGGLIDCGYDPLARALFGQLRPTSGAMTLRGRPYSPRSPRDAIAQRVAYVPPDRDREALLLTLPISANITLTALPRLSHAGLYLAASQRRPVAALVSRLSIRCRGGADLPMNLSGGNRQKVVLAKWLLERADFFVLHSPTRGVDVHAKREIYELVANLAKQGAAIVLVSDELLELIGMCDRILIMRTGDVTHEVARHLNPTEEDLITYMV